MDDDEPGVEPPLDAGDFASWSQAATAAIAGDRSADVPCGTCTACCTASQFVHVGPDEHDTLAHIPAELQFPAPRLPRGHVVLGYDERGRCPMLVGDACSIYEHRPRTCRTYDCRVFAAADVAVDDDKPLIARRAVRWRFTHLTPADRAEHDAVRAAARYLEERGETLDDVIAPVNATQRAVVALEIHDVFLGRDPETDAVTVVEPGAAAVRAAVLRLASYPGAMP